MNAVQKKMRGRPPKDVRSRDQDRQGLIDAAVQIVVEGGSTALTARAVAERAGTAVGSVYTQFESLEALKLEANAVTMRRLRAALTEALAACESDDTADRLLSLAEAYLRYATANHNSWTAIFDRRTIEPPPEIAADIAALFALIEGVLARSGRVGPEEVGIVAKALWSSVHGMVYLGEAGGLGPVGRDDVPGMIQVLVRAAVRGLDHPAAVSRNPA